MRTLGKIYKLWADSQADSSEIIQLWCKLDAYLQAHCDDEIRETMESFLMDYSQRIEHQAFLAGFEEASLVLGASPVKTLFKVTLPCIKTGIVGGAVFSFFVAFDEAVIIMFMRDARYVTFPMRLYTYITESFTPLISAIATIFIIFAVIIIMIVEKTIGLSKLY